MIPNLQAKDYKGFYGGKNTLTALPETPLECCLLAKDCQLGADGVVRKRPGYTLVQKAWSGQVGRLFDFQRQSDGAHWVLGCGAGQLIAMDPAGVAAPNVLSAVDQAAIFDFAESLWACYASNGVQSIKTINNAGTEKVYNWGIVAAAAAPAIATGAGTLTLKYGRQYVYCPVSIITDAQGVTRTHVGAPSPISAHTGPIANSVVTLSTIKVFADPQVTHIWIFETVDTPLNSTSAFYFAAQITNGTTSWGDTLADSALDTTRQAPWNNLPAPLANVLVPYQSRFAAIDIPGKPNLVQLSGFEEIDLGIPAEAWPADLSFQVPGGDQRVIAGKEFANSLMLANADYWFQIEGYNAQTFVKRDKVAQPGVAGPRLVDVTPTHLLWLSKDKKLWAWDTVNVPLEVSMNQRKQLAGTLSMSDLNEATLASAVLRYYSYADKHMILLLANSKPNAGPGFDWIAVWDLDSQGAPLQQSEVAQAGRAAQWDMFPGDLMTAMEVVDNAGTLWIYLANTAGNVYRWPDGWTDAGKLYAPVYGTPWHHLGLQSAFFNQGPSALKKRLYWVDVATDRDDATTAFGCEVACGDGLDMTRVPVALPIGDVPAPEGVDATVFRARHNVAGATLARWLRYVFTFPMDDQPAAVYQYTAAFAPLYQTAP